MDENRPIDVVEERPLNKDGAENQIKTLREKLNYIKNNITVEPLLAGLIIPSVISRFTMVNLNLDKACRVNLQYNDTICDALVQKSNGKFLDYEKEVQKLIASIDIWKSVMQTLIPCIIIMFLGAWSDRTGKRKLCILLPIIGEILTSISNLINVFFFYEIPVEITVFLETIFPALTGGWVTMFLGVFSYISDITSEETRTFRVGVVNFCFTCGLPIGIGLSGILLKKLGYYGIFSLTAFMFTFALIYGTAFLKEPDELIQEKGLPPVERDTKKVAFLDISHVTDTVMVAFKKRPKNLRAKVLLTLFCVFILFGPTSSEHGVFYLFVRNRLNWDMVQFSVYACYSIILHSFGALFSITVLSKRLQIDDSMLCLISVISKFCGSIWTAFIQTDVEMFLIPVAEILNATTFTSLRSITSKIVDKQETAKVNSIFSLTETLASLVFLPFYSWLYMVTLNVFTGAVFLTSAAITIPPAFILTYFYVSYRRERKSARKKALEAEESKTTPSNIVENTATVENNEDTSQPKP